MSKLNEDILYLIFKELQYDLKNIYSCLLVNKIWCEIIILVLWNNPWKYLKNGKEALLLNVIFLHLSNKIKINLKEQGIYFPTKAYQRPLFYYINSCRHLNFNEINR